MVGLVFIALLKVQDEVVRTPSAYWFPASEGIEKWLPDLVKSYSFDTWIADPTPNALTTRLAKGKIRIVNPNSLLTSANRKWRDATVEFAQGKISPKAWLKRTNNLKETYHFLTSPKTPDLRTETANIPNGLGVYSGRAVFAETLTCYWPGRPCFYATDLFRTNYFPENKQYESWVLAMNDYVGPMLNIRAENPKLVTQKPTIVRADETPGMLVFEQVIGKRRFTFFFNNGLKPILLPKSFRVDFAIMPRGLDIDTPKGPFLLGSGSILTIDPPE